MPKETFWPETAVDGDGSEPILTIEWHKDIPGVYFNGVHMDRSGLNRAITSIRRARNATYGVDE